MTVFLHEEAIGELANVFVQQAYVRVLFVVDQDAYRACGADSALESLLASRNVLRFSGFELNPKLADIERGIELSKEFNPDVVVALGGGTAIDIGKLVSSLSVQTATAHDIIIGWESIKVSGIPLIAIPTTAGTGSEATHFAVAYVKQQKYSVAHQSLLPDYAVVDPQLTYSLPASITAASGLDAFCQAIESLWAVGATSESIQYATEAIELAVRHLSQVVNDPTSESRLAMCRASHLAGKAINISKTTAPHALSYALTSHYGIPHGVAVAIMLGPLLFFNSELSDSDCADPRGVNHVQERIATIVRLLNSSCPQQARDRFTQIVSSIGCPTRLSDVGINTNGQLQEIISSINLERASNNPRQISSDALMKSLASELKN